MTATARAFDDPSAAVFRTEVREWLTDVSKPYHNQTFQTENDEIRARRDWELQLAKSGYNCLTWPTSFGGRGLGPIEQFVFADECANAGVPEGLGRIGRLLVGPALFKHGTKDQQQQFLPGILEGRTIWCQGFSEPDAGSDLAAVRTRARRESDGFHIDGQKIWTSFGHYADFCLLLVRTGDPAQRHQNLSMIATPMHQHGVSPQRIRQITGRSEFTQVFYDDAIAPDGNVIGAVNDGWRVAMTVLAAERGIEFAALALKDLNDELDTLSHCLGSGRRANPTLLEQLSGKVAIFRWQVLRTIEAYAAGRDASASSSVLKLIWSELKQRLARAGIRSDCSEHLSFWRFLELDTRSDTIASGTSEIQRNIIGTRVLGLSSS